MIACPACQSHEAKAVRFIVTAAVAAQHFVLREGDHARHAKLVSNISTLWRGNECAVIQCGDCGLAFSSPFVAGDSEFYKLAYPRPNYPTEKWEYQTTVEALAKLDTDGKLVLEVGAGFGHFLETICPQYINPANVLAVEYNETARRRLAFHGYKVSQHDIRSSAFDTIDQPFDYIFMFQVLEHLDSLDMLVERLRLITTQGAHVFIAVPNPLRIDFNERHKSVLDMPPNHISRWSEKAIGALWGSRGFEVVQMRLEPFTWKEFIKQDLVYSHLRRSQRAGSVANRVRSRQSTTLRRMAEAGLTLLFAPARLRVWAEAASARKSLGGSMWVQLRRKDSVVEER